MYQPTVKIKYGWIKEVSWPIVGLFLLKIFGVSSEIQFMISCAILVCVIFLGKKIILPHILGWQIYLVSIGIMSVYGFATNDIYEVVKSEFHVLNTIVLVILGYYLCVQQQKSKSLEKTMLLVGFIICVRNWIVAFSDLSIFGDMQKTRDVFGVAVFDLMFIFAILFCDILLRGKIIYSYKIDRVALLTFIGTIVVSMGRTQLISTIVGIIFIYIFSIVKYNTKRIVKSLLGILTIGSISLIMVFNFLPSEVVDPFVEKMEKSSTEISSAHDFSNISEISNNWRGYENYSAVEQWKKSNAYESIFGQGIGKMIKLNDLNSYFEKQYQLVDSSSPILHNGYSTLLVKGGVFSIVGVAIWLLYPLVKLCMYSGKEEKLFLYIKLVGINIMMAFTMYVVRGLFSQSPFVAWALITGWYNSRILSQK